MLDMVLMPEMIHKMLDIVTEFTIEYLRAQEKINGKLKRLCFVDHLASIISFQHVEEFFMPYTKRIFDEFHYAEVKLWHNEGKCKHILNLIPQIGCNLWQFGDDDIIDAKSKLKNQVVLMGNINPVDLMKFSVRQVVTASEKVMQQGGQDGIFILSSAGGIAPKTPADNLKAMIKTARNFTPTK